MIKQLWGYVDRWLLPQNLKGRLALQELIFLWVITNLPVLGTVLLKFVTKECPPEIPDFISLTHSSLIDWIGSLAVHYWLLTLSLFHCTIEAAMGDGDIFVFAATAMGSSAVVIYKFNKKSEVLPALDKKLLALIVTIFVCALFYALYQVKQITNESRGICFITLLVYVAVIRYWYISILDNDYLNDREREILESQNNATIAANNRPDPSLNTFNGNNP